MADYQTNDRPTEPDDLSPWYIEFRPLADDIPAAIRMRRLLKFALRTLRLKAERISGKPPEVNPSTEKP